MNEGAAKAYRRQQRTLGVTPAAPGRGYVIPGHEIKALWSSLSHKQRGDWRRKFGPSRATLRKVAALNSTGRVTDVVFRAGGVVTYYPDNVSYMDI